MTYFIVKISIYIICFVASFYAISCVQFEKFTNVKQPLKVQLLMLLLSFALAYLVATFLMGLSMQNGIY